MDSTCFRFLTLKALCICVNPGLITEYSSFYIFGEFLICFYVYLHTSDCREKNFWGSVLIVLLKF